MINFFEILVVNIFYLQVTLTNVHFSFHVNKYIKFTEIEYLFLYTVLLTKCLKG